MPMNTKVQLNIIKAKAPTYVVFGAAAYQSFGHAIHLAGQHGAADPWLLPVSIDGLMVVAFRYASHGKTPAARCVARGVLGFAMAAMLTINYLAAPTGDLVGQALSVLPALGMIMTTVLIHLVPVAKAPVRRRPAARKNVTSITKNRKATA